MGRDDLTIYLLAETSKKSPYRSIDDMLVF